METAASSEVRNAPSSYPTGPRLDPTRELYPQDPPLRRTCRYFGYVPGDIALKRLR
jgi:hypothetical protein